MHGNERVAAVFDQLADLLEIEDANPFRVRAYRNAARTVRALGRELSELRAEGRDLTTLPGIGKDLAEKIVEILDTGTTEALEELHRRVPAGLEDLLQVPGLGPKRVRALHAALAIDNLAGLREAAQAGRLRELGGFGAKTEQTILEAIAARRTEERRHLLVDAERQAEPLAAHLRDLAGVKQVVVAGSYRRGRETVGDLDVLVTARRGSAVMERFVGYPRVERVVSKGPTRSTVLLAGGLQVDLRLLPERAFGAALHYFTGSKAHNIQIRRLAQRQQLKINEYGVFRGDDRLTGKTEKSVFKAVGLPWIAPELREDGGEIDAAREGRLPRLVERRQLRGDLHVHSRNGDGRNTPAELASAARDAGLRYLAMTDRPPRTAGGIDTRRLRRQWGRIDVLNEELEGVTLLKGVEVEILRDGGLDLPDGLLADADLVVGVVCEDFGLNRARQTERILRAMDNPWFTVLAHPTGRLLLECDPYDMDVARVVRHAAERGCFLELNSQPRRLDLADVYCRMARDEGVLLVIDSDAREVNEIDYLRYGVQQARRGWLEAAHVANTRPLTALRKLIAAMRP